MSKAGDYLPNRPGFRVLSERQIHELHLSALELLETTGVEIDEEEALSLLREAGCSVRDKRVRIPSQLVRRALDSAPERAAIRDRNGANGMLLEDGRSYYGTGSDCLNTLDVKTGERRDTVWDDVASLAKLTDFLPNLDFVMSMGLASDRPEETADVHNFAAMVTNTTKPIVFTAFSLRSLEVIHEICCAVAGGEDEFRRRPFAVHYSEPLSPLTHTREAVEKVLFCAKKAIPLVYVPGPMAGATAPVTLAGAVTLASAECLSGLVVHQLRRPGAPFVYGGLPALMDMRTSIFAYGAPEIPLMSAALAEMAHHYGLPAWGTACCTDAKVVDQQTAAEYMSSSLIAGLAGANLIHDSGYLESGATSSHESIVLANEVHGYVRRILRGIRVDSETIALDVIAEEGPGGTFLASEHTLNHFAGELWFPRLFDRERHPGWQAAGSRTLLDRLNQEANRILEEHTPEPLADEKRSKIDEILERL